MDTTRRFYENLYARISKPYGVDGAAAAYVPYYRSGGRALDIGAGAGQNVARLARCGFRVTALDFSANALRETRRTACEARVSVSTVQADARELPFCPTSLFDVVCASFILHHFMRSEGVEMLDRVRALTAPGGLHALTFFTPVGEFASQSDRSEDGWFPHVEELRLFYPDWCVRVLRHWNIRCRTTRSDGTPLQNEAASVLLQKSNPAHAA